MSQKISPAIPITSLVIRPAAPHVLPTATHQTIACTPRVRQIKGIGLFAGQYFDDDEVEVLLCYETKIHCNGTLFNDIYCSTLYYKPSTRTVCDRIDKSLRLKLSPSSLHESFTKPYYYAKCLALRRPLSVVVPLHLLRLMIMTMLLAILAHFSIAFDE